MTYQGTITNETAYGLKKQSNPRSDILETADCGGPFFLHGIPDLLAGCYDEICVTYHSVRQFAKKNIPGRVQAIFKFTNPICDRESVTFLMNGEITGQGDEGPFSLFPTLGNPVTVDFTDNGTGAGGWFLSGCEESGCVAGAAGEGNRIQFTGLQMLTISVTPNRCDSLGPCEP